MRAGSSLAIERKWNERDTVCFDGDEDFKNRHFSGGGEGRPDLPLRWAREKGNELRSNYLR